MRGGLNKGLLGELKDSEQTDLSSQDRGTQKQSWEQELSVERGQRSTKDHPLPMYLRTDLKVSSVTE